MKTVSRVLIMVLLLFGSRTMMAQTITFAIGNTGTFTIASAVAGQNPTSVSSTLPPVSPGSFTTTTANKDGVLRIRAQLDQPMPANTSLTLTITYPVGTNQGAKALGVAPVDMVVSIPKTNGSRTGTVSYTFAATAGAGVLAPFQRIVTLTIVP